MESISPELFILLVGIATLAGAVDAIAGGGGLITLPALLFFALGGHVVWQLGLLLGLGQAAGAWLGPTWPSATAPPSSARCSQLSPWPFPLSCC